MYFLTAALTGSTVLTMIGAFILLAALIPPFLDTVRSKKTYGITDKFLLCYTCGAFLMWVNAVTAIAGASGVEQYILFSTLILVNTVSVVLNSYILKIKKSNMKAASEMGLSEQDYYETVLKSTLEK